MTPEELDLFRLKVRVAVLLNLVRGLYTGLANSSPAAHEALLEKFSALRQDHSKIVLKGIAAEYSDMLAAEYQEALDEYLKDIESGLRKF